MQWPSLSAEVRIDLLEDRAPVLCEDIWNSLPFETIQSHALITGEMMFATSPVTTLVRENVTLFTDMGVGAAFFGSSSQNFGLIYGGVNEPEGHPVWGRVRQEDVPELQRVGLAAWTNLVRPYGDGDDNPGVLTKRAIRVACSRA
jgi:hypothetical protein